MISKDGMKRLYKIKAPSGGYSKEFLQGICDKCSKYHKLHIADGNLVIGALDEKNPFRSLRLSCVKSIEDLGDEVVVVLEPCILFFNNVTGIININFRRNRFRDKLEYLRIKLCSLFHKPHPIVG